jgi:flavodoxin
MVKTLVVYYSKTGNTRTVAEAIAGKLGSDLQEVNEQGAAQAPAKDPSAYDLVVVGTPVNGFSPSIPIQGYLKENRGRLPNVALYATYSLWPAGTLGGMEKLAGKKPVASGAFKSREIKLGQIGGKVDGFVEALRRASS